MNGAMVGISFLWAIFTFVFYRGLYARHVRHVAYAEFARATFAAVKAHYPELKKKSITLVVDKGFGVKDDEAWQEALHTFITHRVVPELDAKTRARLKASSATSKDFSTLSVNFVLALIAQPQMSETYSLTEIIDSIEERGDAAAFLSGTAKYLPRKEITTRLALVLLAIGMSGQSAPSHAANGEAFSPLSACNALVDVDGFQPNKSGYSELYEGVYSCATRYKELGKQALANNVALYGKGTVNEVTRVKLMLNVNVASRGAQDTKLLATLCTKMVGTVTGTAPIGLEEKIAQGKPFQQPFDGYRVYLDKTVWPTGKGYELNCGIATKNHEE